MPYKDPEVRRKVQRLWYQRHKEMHLFQIKTKTAYRRKYVVEYKQNNPTCKDCGIDYPSYVLDFDHLPQFEKSFPLSSSGVKNRSIESINAEIAKCEIVCSNCHRHRTAIRKSQARQIDNK
jgi:Zn finger protein HypA/HybF involved in hydrogenase expression